MVADWRALHSARTEAPIVSTESGIAMFLSTAHERSALSPIETTPSGMSIDGSSTQPMKASFLMVSSVSGSVTLVSFWRSRKIPVGRLVTSEGTVTLVSAVDEKA